MARFKRRERVRDRNECHRVTTSLTRRFGMVVVEDLKVGNMTRSGGSYKRGLNREILGQTWGMLRGQLAYKAEWAGRRLVEVDPRYTSRACSECGEVQPKPKEYRLFRCSDCGHVADRDVNAAKNILQRGRELVAGGITAEVVDSYGAARKIFLDS